jgi:hypothetical protein
MMECCFDKKSGTRDEHFRFLFQRKQLAELRLLRAVTDHSFVKFMTCDKSVLLRN